MDSLSHAVIGIALASLSGESFSLNDPVYLAALIGSQAPDLDIIAHAKGEFTYLQQHRVFSHCIPGIALLSILTSLGFFLFGQHNLQLFLTTFIWCFLGALSHIIVDYLNTHGVAFLWPISKKRRSLHLLNVFDPCLLILMLSVFTLKLPPRMISLSVFFIFAGYSCFRYFLRRKAWQQLSNLFPKAEETLVFPSLKRTFFWDFIVKTSHCIYVGQIGAFRPVLSIYAKLSKEEISDLTQMAQKTNLGQFFSIFTPLSYIQEEPDVSGKTKIVRIYDLRYYFEEGFAYSAAIIFGSNNLPCDSYIYTYRKKFKIPCF